VRCARVSAVSPTRQVEVTVLHDIAEVLRQWADLLDRLAGQVGDAQIGPAWGENDLTELYQAWLEVGHAIRDVARSRPHEAPELVRDEVASIRDRMGRITEILDRNARSA
jgi:hypothetical protein